MLSTTIIATIFVIGLLVFVHELGHFITAKAVGMRVHEFALGFGPKLISKQHGETLYSLRIVPLGGFNKIAGMDPDEEQDEYSFNAKPIWARILVIVAGPVMNFVLPVLLFFLVFLASGIDSPSDEAIIGTVLADRPAAQAGLVVGDRILAVNGAKIETWRQFVSVIQVNAGNRLMIAYQRNDQTGNVAVTPEFDPKANRGIIGVVPQIVNYRPGPVEAVSLAGQQVYAIGTSMLVGIGQMITGRASADVAGPIGVAQMAGQVAQLGLLPLLQFAAFLSINLGLINLLPVPVLDGGHIVTLAVEAVRGKPLSPRKAQFFQMIGFTLLMLLLLLATFKDITRLKLF
ncbi:MAG: RIP metalloprotease RseP [Negativicutes bacterium]|nr:RIP metalloprotease RseP [Negativicutes bacterium]